MKIIHGLEQFNIDGETAVSIGKFDGIHLGHKKLVENLLAQKKRGLKSVVFTFDPDPGTFFSGRQMPILMTIDEKRRWFEKNEIDILVEFPLNNRTAVTPPEAFIEDILSDSLHAKFISAGMDVSFGDRGKGDYHLLQKMAGSYGYELSLIPKVRIEGKEISSTYVRSEVAAGNMEMATKLLGCPYQVSGIVEHGRSFGHTIGIPTVNLLPEKGKLLPPNGVYYSYVYIDGIKHNGMTNIGCKPTVSNSGQVGVETFIYDFNENIYGEFIEVQLLSYRRAEMHFDSIEALKNQMNKDVSDGVIFHEKYEKDSLQEPSSVVK